MKIYRVIFGNYYPRETDREYLTFGEALIRAKELGGMWRVEEVEIEINYAKEDIVYEQTKKVKEMQKELKSIFFKSYFAYIKTFPTKEFLKKLDEYQSNL